MEKKKVVATASLSIILLASLALVAPIPPASADPGENHLYWVMGGIACSITDPTSYPDVTLGAWTTPYHTRPPYLRPLFGQLNITFSDPWQLDGYGWIVNLTVPHETYVGLQHVWYDNETTHNWYNITLTLEEDGYGWIFLNATGDVDCYTFNNITGSYWKSPSLKAGEKAANMGDLPDVGTDGVAGTADDGFGDNVTDPAGSSILMLPGRMTVRHWWGGKWTLLYLSPWPQVFTTRTAYDIVIAPGRRINGHWNTTEGEPWEFLAGIDHAKEGWKVDYGPGRWNAYVTYACVWSAINVSTGIGPIDVIFQAVQKLVREDCVIPDVKAEDEKVNIKDIGRIAVAFGTLDEGPGPDGTPNTADDKKFADPNYDAGGDLMSPEGKIHIKDIGRVAIDFGAYLTPNGIIRP